MKSPSLVRPRRFTRDDELKRIIYIPWDLRSAPLLSALKKLAPARRYETFGHIFRLGNLAVLHGATGAPLACLALEPLILSGAKEIVLLGFCGSLVRKFAIGDALSVRAALPDEGTSGHYLPGRRRFRPSASSAAALEAFLGARGISCKKGTIISTDAPYRETQTWLRRALVRGAQAVDMETSAVLALAEYHGIMAASLQVVSDELFTGVWRPGFSSSELLRRVRDCFLPLLGIDA